MTLQEVVARFNTTPFLFAGSGITRRYYGCLLYTSDAADEL